MKNITDIASQHSNRSRILTRKLIELSTELGNHLAEGHLIAESIETVEDPPVHWVGRYLTPVGDKGLMAVHSLEGTFYGVICRGVNVTSYMTKEQLAFFDEYGRRDRGLQPKKSIPHLVPWAEHPELQVGHLGGDMIGIFCQGENISEFVSDQFYAEAEKWYGEYHDSLHDHEGHICVASDARDEAA